jgi:cytochrome c556
MTQNDMTELLPKVGTWMACAVCGALLAAVASGSLAIAQAPAPPDQSAATPKDAIFARKILMDTIGSNMDEIEGMLESTGALNLAEAREHADNISVMMMAFPHIFPLSTNQWKAGAERDPGTDTFASPEVWTRYSDFYRMARETSQAAYKASRAETEADFRAIAGGVREHCNACHAIFLKND